MTTKITKPSCWQKFGLHWDEVDPAFHDPHIINGYREPGMSVSDCLRSTTVHYCNETVNVWTHFVAFLYFFVNFFYRYTNGAADIFNWPLVAYSLGCQGFCLMSALAHTFNSISPTMRNICFSLDYAAINVYVVGAAQAFFFYSRPLEHSYYAGLFRHPVVFSVVSVLLSFATTVQCCVTRQKKSLAASRYLYRTASLVMPFIWTTSPYLFRLASLQNDDNSIDSTSTTSSFFYLHGSMYMVAAVINVIRVPERYYPGMFCAIGQSHHWMHILTAVGAAVQLEGVRADLINRKGALVQQEHQSDSRYSLVYMFVAMVVNFSVAVWFGCNTTETNNENMKSKSVTNKSE